MRALQLGGDDYLVKPFNAAVLLAKIDAHLRRMHNDFPALDPDARTGELCSAARTTLCTPPQARPISPPRNTAFSSFSFTIPRRVLELEEIYRAIWDRPSCGDVRTVPVHVHNLRKKIEPEPNAPRYIKTVKRIGYCFDDAPDEP